MKKIHIESKSPEEATKRLNKINPDVWEAYTTTDMETLEIIYCVDCYVMKEDE